MSVNATAISEDLRLLSIKSLAGAYGVHPKTLARRINDAGLRVVRVNKYDPSIYQRDAKRLLAFCEEARA